MRKLSVNQEVKLLKLLKNCKPIDRGSSRLCFVHPLDETKVIKLAIGKKALCQNKLETATFKEYGETLPLAEIFEYGRFVIVMERMKRCFDPSELEDGDYYGEFDNFPDDDTIYEIVEQLESVFGSTTDNYQLGYNQEGDLVSYDYGFDPSRGCFVMCGFAEDIGKKTLRPYIDSCIKLLKEKKPVNQIDRLAQ